MASFTVALAQLNPLVGDIPGNTRLVIEHIQRARDELGAEAVLFSELVLCGYPPEDLLLRPSITGRIDKALKEVARASAGITVVVGYPARRDTELYNMAGVFRDGQQWAEYAKQRLPNNQVFDEKRYFAEGDSPAIFDLCGIPTAVSICEDIWHPQPMVQARERGVRLMLNMNGSPFHLGKQAQRQQLLAQRAQEGNMPILYANQVGGQDELVFDGGSMVVDAKGELRFQAPLFAEGLYPVKLAFNKNTVSVPPQQIAPAPLRAETVYQALVTGVRDYVNKNGFKGIVLGLSGGIDSALTLAVAVDALGADRVEAVMMPFRYTSQLSRDDAEAEANALSVGYSSIAIETLYDDFVTALAQEFAGLPVDKTEENLQARIRGMLIMAISNKKGYLVLTTGNKSEMAVGYATLYGDMAGGFAVLKDVPKTLVFELARYRNSLSRVIPETVITRPPSAELAPGQKDEDSLPPYAILDQIIELYVEKDCSASDIIARGFDAEVVNRVIRMIDLNEYKRRQAPVGIRISERAFGRDRRYPITNGWQAGD